MRESAPAFDAGVGLVIPEWWGLTEYPQANDLSGAVGYQAAADRRSWAHLRDFFAEVLAAK